MQSTGRMTYVQLFSMLFSLFTLTVNASRAFFIQRGKDEADPAPNPHMILKVFPYMLMQVLESLNMILLHHNFITIYSCIFLDSHFLLVPQCQV